MNATAVVPVARSAGPSRSRGLAAALVWIVALICVTRVSGCADPVTGRVEVHPVSTAEIEAKRTKTGHLLVRPIVNGVQPGWFIFDTGAGICVVSTPHVSECKLTTAGKIEAQGVGGSDSKSLYNAATFELGPIVLHDEPILATDLSFLNEHLGEEIIGVVGYGFLNACVAELDIAAPRIAIHDPAKYSLTSGAWSPLDIDDRVATVHARFEGHDGTFRLDTGANGFVTFHKPTVDKWSLLEGRESRGPVTDTRLGGVGGFVNARKGTLDWFELGGVRREKIPVEFAMEAKGTFADAAKDGNIGADMLKAFTLVLDYPHKRIAFQRKPESKPDAKP